MLDWEDMIDRIFHIRIKAINVDDTGSRRVEFEFMEYPAEGLAYEFNPDN